jgi:hypothetical protein
MSCSVCHGGTNKVLPLDVPSSDNSTGPAVDTSAMEADKTIEITGNYTGTYTVLGSHDGVLYSPIATFDSGAGNHGIKQSVSFVLKSIKVRRKASAMVRINVASRSVCTC